MATTPSLIWQVAHDVNRRILLECQADEKSDGGVRPKYLAVHAADGSLARAYWGGGASVRVKKEGAAGGERSMTRREAEMQRWDDGARADKSGAIFRFSEGQTVLVTREQMRGGRYERRRFNYDVAVNDADGISILRFVPPSLLHVFAKAGGTQGVSAADFEERTRDAKVSWLPY